MDLSPCLALWLDVVVAEGVVNRDNGDDLLVRDEREVCEVLGLAEDRLDCRLDIRVGVAGVDGRVNGDDGGKLS